MYLKIMVFVFIKLAFYDLDHFKSAGYHWLMDIIKRMETSLRSIKYYHPHNLTHKNNGQVLTNILFIKKKNGVQILSDSTRNPS